MRVWAVLCCVASMGCGGEDDGALLIVDVRTSLEPGVDFERVHTDVREPGAEESVADVDRPADPELDYSTGGRAAEIRLAPGEYTVSVDLACGGIAIASATAEIVVEGNRGVLLDAITTAACPHDGGRSDAGSDAGAPDASLDGGPDAGMANCVSGADRATLAREDYGAGMNETFDVVIDRRTRECLLMGATSSPALHACVRDALVFETDVSTMCSECYARAAVCTVERCWHTCYFGGSSAACVDCRCSSGCEADVESCSGVPRSMCGA